MHFFLATGDWISSTHRHTTDLPLEYPLILPVSAGVRADVDQLCFLETVRGSQFDGVAAFMAWKNVVSPNWDELTALDSISFVYFDKEFLVGFLPNRIFPFVQNLCPIRGEVGKEASEF